MGASVWRVERTAEDPSRQKRPETDKRKSRESNGTTIEAECCI